MLSKIIAVIIIIRKNPCNIRESRLIIIGLSLTEDISLISLIIPMPLVELLLEELEAIEDEANSRISIKVVKF